MDAAVRVVCSDKFLQRLSTCVDRVGLRVGYDEEVVDVGLGGAEGEWLVVAAFKGGEGGRFGVGDGNTGGVEGEVGVGDDADLGPLDGWRGGVEVEIAGRSHFLSVMSRKKAIKGKLTSG